MEIAYTLIGGLLFASGLFCGLKLVQKNVQKPVQSNTPMPLDEKALKTMEDDLQKAQEIKKQWDALMAYTGRERGGV